MFMNLISNCIIFLHSISISIMRKFPLLLFASIIFLSACNNKPVYDTIIRNGIIYDGSGAKPSRGDIAINADTIAFIGDLSDAKAAHDIDAKGMAVSPGFR